MHDKKTLDMNGDILEVRWDGNVWISPCNGRQHARARDAMRSELQRYLSDCGEDADEIEEHLDRMENSYAP